MQTTEVHVLMGRTIPNPHQRYSTIKCEIGMTGRLEHGETTQQALAALQNVVRHQLEALLEHEISSSTQ